LKKRRSYGRHTGLLFGLGFGTAAKVACLPKGGIRRMGIYLSPGDQRATVTSTAPLRNIFM
jgi:hypothetical protein